MACGSLVINAFSGVTAMRKQSRVKVARQWQIVLRKQHQQVAQGKKVRKAVKTTETSQEEVTQETAKQAETKAPLETPEIKQTQQNNLQKIVVKMTDKEYFAVGAE